MSKGILSPDISQKDALVSLASIELLQPYIMGDERSLVFFAGAGASTAGNTGMPTTQALLQQILLDALNHSKEFNTENTGLVNAIKQTSDHIGFEITLNDFWQICRRATTQLYESFAEFEKSCAPNRVHAFLAYWLSIGGIVVTTNFDRLIEREWLEINQNIDVRYQEEGSCSFTNWRDPMNRGGCLFKLHGSLDAPESCLGALEHVTTHLAGQKASLLAEIVQHRPLCVVGWSGIDPDIPPLLSDLYDSRSSSLPVFWLHYEGYTPDLVSLQDSINKTSTLVREYASTHPILTEADRTFGEILRDLDIGISSKPTPTTVILDFSKAVNQCSASGVTRFAGIVVRRAGQLDLAGQILDIALELALSPEECSSAIQELSLLQQQKTGRKTNESRKLLQQARKALGEKPDLRLQINADFGVLSMTIIGLRLRPWLLLKLPILFRKYRQNIETLRRETTDKETVALHDSLLYLYQGRLRFMLFGWLTIALPPLAAWILRPFNIARSTIDDAKDIHLHSRIDVLAYRAVAIARLRRSQSATEDVPEINRLILILKDNARLRYWEIQRHEIERYCGITSSAQ